MANRTDAQKLAEIRKVAAMTGAAGASTGEGKAPKEGGDSVLGGLKKVGGTALKALSVPQAALLTSGAKLGGANISWGNAGGDFYKAANGMRGTDNVLNNAGITNKWARLGVGLAADPLWFVGGGLVKGSKAVVEAEKAFEASADVATGIKASKALMNQLYRKAARSTSKETTAKLVKEADREKKKLAKLQSQLDKEKAVHAEKLRLKDVEHADIADIFKADKFGRGENLSDSMHNLRVSLSKHEARSGMNYGISFGAGKFKKTVNTGINAQRGLLGKKSAEAFKPGLMAMKPIEKVAHALRRSGGELADATGANMLHLADTFGFTEKLANGGIKIQDDAANVLGSYLAARQVNQGVGDAVKGWLETKGMWSPKHDDFIKQLDERNKMYKEADRLKPDTRVPDAEKGVKAAEKKVEEAKAVLAGKDSAANAKKVAKAEEELARKQEELRLLNERGAYAKQGQSQESLQAKMEKRKDEVLKGIQAPGNQYRRFKDPKDTQAGREVYDNPFATTTMDEYIEAMTKAGMDEKDAGDMAHLIANELAAKGLPTFREEIGKVAQPEWNAFTLAGRRENEHIMAQVDHQIMELMKNAGLGTKGKSHIAHVLLYGEQGGPWAKSAIGNKALGAVAKFKGILTTVNPSHYVRNLTGDFLNSLVNGNIRHATHPGGALPRSEMSKLANATVWAGEGRMDREALDAIHNIGGREYTGAELMALSRMVGLGRGYVGTDIAIMNEAFARADNKGGEFYRFMQRMNVKRENAQRLHTFVLHMKAGDDAVMASVKTLRVHFDYTQLTEFERLTLRNVLLFYTWMKRNLVLQTSGLATRPGLYNAYNTIEGARPKIPNEPDYYKHQNAIPIPGLGAFNIGAPIADLRKFELGFESFRRDVLGAVTPPIRIPTELATNQKFFTGQRIENYSGELTPTWYAQLAKKLGVPLTDTTQKSGGGMAAGINPQLAYAISQLTGPQAANVQAASDPDAEGNIGGQALGRFLGVAPQANQPVKFERAAKYIQAKKKADATRARNAQGGK